METCSALLALSEGNPPVTDGFPSQRPVTLSFDAFFDMRLKPWTNGLANNRDAGDFRRHRAHYDDIVIGEVCPRKTDEIQCGLMPPDDTIYIAHR